ncbi:hypothetical protein JRQ81_009119 [Phrynocephalus forsythii]|uniref:SAC3/GANP/THP3 conserved domain-containing protein n=1 Tax=Phrynocephalus forsythii TaxID=171643 RepID=A0A9Q0X9N6_9SAUR|nr:hypothetical protein JRQ81_009119 [Phrynocephalus forsythii]
MGIVCLKKKKTTTPRDGAVGSWLVSSDEPGVPIPGAMRRSSSSSSSTRRTGRAAGRRDTGSALLAPPGAVGAEAEAEALPGVVGVVGTCPGMCPSNEFALRQRLRRLHRLELGPSPERLPDPERAVKEYSRPAAGKPPPRPDELRPPAVLLATAAHLLQLAGQDGEEDDDDDEEDDGGQEGVPTVSAADRGAFVADRLRALRLDLTLQRLSGPPAAAVLEHAVAALLHAGHRLSAEPPSRFDAQLHRAQLQETLGALRRAYRHGEGARLPRQPGFQALFLLYNLGSAEALWQILQLPKEIRNAPELRTAMAIHSAFLERNFARFFRLAGALPYLPSCALHPHLGSARRLALMIFSHGFSARNCRYPLPHLAQLLATDDLEEMAELCRAHGLAVTEGCVHFQKGAFKDAGPQAPRPSRLLVGRKRGKASLLELLEKMCH